MSRKSKTKTDSRNKDRDAQESSHIIKTLTNYSAAIQVVPNLTEENKKLRHDLEYLRQQQQKCALERKATLKEAHENEIHSQQQQQRISDLEACLKEIKEKEIRSQQQQQLRISELEASLNEKEIRSQQQQRVSELEAHFKERARLEIEVRCQQQQQFISELKDTLKNAQERLIQNDEEKKAIYDTLHRLQQQQRVSELEADFNEKARLEIEVRCQQQQQFISELKDSLKNAQERLIQNDEEKKAIYDTLHRQDTLLRGQNEDKKATCDQQMFKTDATFNPSLIQELLSVGTINKGILEEILEKEMRDHSDLQIKVNKLKSDMLKGQTEFQEVLKQLQHLSSQTNSKLTELLGLAEDGNDRSHTNLTKCASHLFGFALRVEKEIEDVDKVKNLGFKLHLHPDKVEKLASEFKHHPKELFWKVFYEWTDGTPCLPDLISSCHDVGICQFQDGMMSPQHRKAIEQSYSRLAADIFVPHVIPHLRDYGILTPRDVEYILSPKTRLDKFRRLVDILPLFGEKAFDNFVEALNKTGQQRLAKILSDEFEQVTGNSPKLSKTGVNTLDKSDARIVSPANLSDLDDCSMTRMTATIVTEINQLRSEINYKDYARLNTLK